MSNREYATPFSILHAASLLSHKRRIMKFDRALERVVKQDDYVIDIGTGSGILAILAAKRGGRVTAIEINVESLKYAQKAAELNDVDNRVEFICEHFSEYVPSERADVVICEMLSSMMLIEQQIPASSHAIENFLKPAGKILPETVSVFLAPVQNDILWRRFEILGLLFPRLPQTAEQGQCRDLSDLQEIAHFDLTRTNRNVIVEKTLSFTIVDDGIAHGLVGMFEARLCDEIVLNMEDGWKELFVPFERPVNVTKGDCLQVEISYCPGKFDTLNIEVR
ncbi:methyltransferase domain-containing protein [Candidatus Thorarchaeota archaeon]|nr:MAG: methyltransferase domain-containing protein [Candidatus Thorarchaeota archaeon]